ncbi:unnamed protein product [Cuscuta europaea]|uniref:Uncharacterized protein n=1 Tax=Cuscuta europaea TaxID=41803 RepID=A0A9P0YWL2_CUSEU|nr:unnamed protein product [Cuscuta europaea]
MAALRETPPGYDPVMDAPKAMSKAAKRNERKKEKRLQAALEKEDDIEDNDGVSSASVNHNHLSDQVEFVAAHMNELAVSSNLVDPPSNSNESLTGDHLQDIDKKIRALKKKIRLTEAQQQKTDKKDMKPEQLEKMAKLEGWHAELKLLEGKRAEFAPLVA